MPTLPTTATRYGTLLVYGSTGALAAPDSAPTVTLERNGATDATGTTITYSNPETGRYRYSYPLTAYTNGDEITEIKKATVSGVSYAATDGVVIDAAVSGVSTAIGNLNNLSALANLYGPAQIEIPASGSIAYSFQLIIRDTEGHLIDLSGTPTLVITNAAGTDRSLNVSAVTHASTGIYSFTYTAQSTAAQEGISISANGVSAADSTARHAYLSVAIVSIDTVTAINSIQTGVANTLTAIGQIPAAPTAAQNAAAILLNPANKIVTDGNNRVTTSNPATVNVNVTQS